jgi:hypothetical protein
MARIVQIGKITVSSNTPCEKVIANHDHIKEWDVLLRVKTKEEAKQGVWKRMTKDGFSMGRGYGASPYTGGEMYETSSGWGH